PLWMSEAYDYLTAAQLGEGFDAALSWWAALERAYDFKTSSRGLPTTSRPPQIGHWTQVLRRDLVKQPQIPDVAEYGQQWWAWWRALQPSWRSSTANNTLARDGKGPWDSLVRPGKNGILMVLLALRWWHGALSANAESSQWTDAVADVTWVVAEMV
ncbi:hypothetical protein PHLGIDRAFT_44687, partial [Phlebiopsis gigantea 11061_1 CR5-6]